MGQEDLIAIREKRITSIISDASKRLGLKSAKRFSGGHMSVPLFECESANGTLQVAKFGIDEETIREVENNRYGYDAIKAVGAASILPGGIYYEEKDGSPFLLINHVGVSFAESVKAGEANLYDLFIAGIEGVYKDSLHTNTRSIHETGVRQIKNEVALWQQRLIERGYLPEDAIASVSAIDVKANSGNNTTLMLSDFTPDNIFIQNGEVKFIDPWRQDTYLGTPIPGIAQFITLAADVYHLPGAVKMKRAFEELAYRVGATLGLTETQINNQLRLGKAMQLALSSFVRIGKDDVLARQFALESYNAVKGLEG